MFTSTLAVPVAPVHPAAAAGIALDLLDGTEGPGAFSDAGRILASVAAGAPLSDADAAALVVLCDDLLGIAASAGGDPAPFAVARAAVGALPGGADDCGAAFLPEIIAAHD